MRLRVALRIHFTVHTVQALIDAVLLMMSLSMMRVVQLMLDLLIAIACSEHLEDVNKEQGQTDGMDQTSLKIRKTDGEPARRERCLV